MCGWQTVLYVVRAFPPFGDITEPSKTSLLDDNSQASCFVIWSENYLTLFVGYLLFPTDMSNRHWTKMIKNLQSMTVLCTYWQCITVLYECWMNHKVFCYWKYIHPTQVIIYKLSFWNPRCNFFINTWICNAGKPHYIKRKGTWNESDHS